MNWVSLRAKRSGDPQSPDIKQNYEHTSLQITSRNFGNNR